MKSKHFILKVLAHACIIISGMLITFFVIDRVNPFMEFLTSEMSIWLIFAFALITLAQSIIIVVMLRRHEKSARKHSEYELNGESRELTREELEKMKAEADREFLETLRNNIAKKHQQNAAFEPDNKANGEDKNE